MEVIRIKPKHFPVPVAPFSYGIKVKRGDFLFIPNQIPTDSKGQIIGKGDIVSQATKVFENLKAILAEVNATFEDIIKMTWYLTAREKWRPVVQVRGQYFKEKWPAATFVLVDRLSRDDVLIEVNAIAALRCFITSKILEKEKINMDRKIILPRDYGGIEEPVVFGLKVSEAREWLFIAGTVPRDNRNVVVGKRDVKKQIAKVFENLEDILKEGGATFNDVVQMNVYLTEESFRTPYLEFAKRIFKNSPIAQTIVVVRGLHDPEVLIEIDGIACPSTHSS